ncbi:OLC1v1032736C1 [Oldenlandia corymbosa var. corymbosa]|uniref:Large ribosomal subunit protein bL32m n=1 Tax=Oldenlandia corymbosa var. corymbosa TaxID=529605 RepID=A0AAV1CPN8_OLDCO|nr:OLC1v1032736C1 [Oldenlandia corymbosa var. corymbosa]
MASRVAMLRNAAASGSFGLRRWAHTMAQPSPLQSSMDGCSSATPPLVLPESETNYDNYIGFHLPSFSLIQGSMELMAVPKKKVSRHKRGIRNGPKALKPVPVIIRCRACGRVKLPHFFCCSGIKPNPGEED